MENEPSLNGLTEQSDYSPSPLTRENADPCYDDASVRNGKARPAIKPRVVVADDEDVIADTLAMILNHAGFEARAVYSGEEALELVPSFKPDILITDVIMHGITGIETAIKVRAMLPSCKVLLFSGQACTANLLEEARAQGHEFEILSKPVHPADMLARMRDAVPVPRGD